MNWFEDVPKVELHVHLEGAIPHHALWELIQKYGGDPSVPDLDALQARFEYKDFPHFLQIWTWKNQFLREYEDFTYVAEQVAQDLARQNIRYVEAFFCPADFECYRVEVAKLTQAIRAGLSRVQGVEVALVADSPRDCGPERAEKLLTEIRELKELGVIGLGMGGSEHVFPPEPFQQVYEHARELGFRTSAHAGEAAGPESIWGAIRALHVDRIGHGTRAQEDDSLLDYLAEHRIPLEMCPLSNVATGVVPSLEEHPVRRYFERGILVTVNTDDPKMFGNSLAEEFRLLEQVLGFSRDETRVLILNGIEASWLPEESKRELAEAFRQDATWEQ